MKIKDIMCKSILGVLAFIILWIVLQGILDFDTIIYSAGKIGFQVETSLDELGKVVAFTVGKLII